MWCLLDRVLCSTRNDHNSTKYQFMVIYPQFSLFTNNSINRYVTNEKRWRNVNSITARFKCSISVKHDCLLSFEDFLFRVFRDICTDPRNNRLRVFFKFRQLKHFNGFQTQLRIICFGREMLTTFSTNHFQIVIVHLELFVLYR